MKFKQFVATAFVLASLSISPANADTEVAQTIPIQPTIEDIVESHGEIDKYWILNLVRNDRELISILGPSDSMNILISMDHYNIVLTMSKFEGKVYRFARVSSGDVGNEVEMDVVELILKTDTGFNVEGISSTSRRKLSVDDIKVIQTYFNYYLNFDDQFDYYFKVTTQVDKNVFQNSNRTGSLQNKVIRTFSIGQLNSSGELAEGAMIIQSNYDIPLTVEIRGNFQNKKGPLTPSEAYYFVQNLKTVFGALLQTPGFELDPLLPPDSYTEI